MNLSRLNRPRPEDWKKWSWEDYLVYFLCITAAKNRAQRKEKSITYWLTESDLAAFCEPIRERLAYLFSSREPQISIQMPTRNDEVELLATLVSYTLLDFEPGRVELIVCDNGSTDHTRAILQACGIKHVYVPEAGMGRARRGAYDQMSKTAEFVWLTDGDARTVAPFKSFADLSKRSTILRTNLDCMLKRPDVIGLSTGIVYEYAHPLFRLIRYVAVRLGKAPQIHAWTGPNQFVRRTALDAIGGINPNVPYRAREDHQRMYELARYGKTIRANMLSAATDRSLLDPVYHSGRRRGTLSDIFRTLRRGKQVARGPRDRYGFPIHPADTFGTRNAVS